MRIPISIALLFAGLTVGASARAQDAATAAFAIGRGGTAAQLAVDVQQSLRQQCTTQGSAVDYNGLLDPDDPTGRLRALQEAEQLLATGKAAYEQLDLEEAQSSFDLTLKKLEYGLGYLDKSSLLIETLLYLGASWVLVGETDKAIEAFQRATDLPGRKTLSSDLFPPNIQEVYNQAAAGAASKDRGVVALTSEPLGAAIEIDGQYRGGTPLEVSDLRIGVHLLRALKDGYRPWGGKIKVEANRVRRFKMSLKPTTRQTEFSEKFRAMAGEALKGEPGPAASAMASLLVAGRLALVVCEGEREALAFRGHLCQLADGTLKIATVKQTLDTTSPGYQGHLRDFLLKVLSSTPGSEGFAAGAADAERLLAQTQEGEGSELGMDLAEDLGSDSGTPPPTETAAADAGGETPGGTTPGAEDTSAAAADEVKAEQQREAAEQVKAAAKQKPPVEDEPGFAWGTIYREWWFWTAVGVVVAGAAVGTALAVTGSGSEGGELVIGLH